MAAVNVDAGSTMVTVAAQFLFGIAVKRWPPLAAWPNKLIPWFNYAIGVLAAIGSAQIATPAHAQVGPGVASVVTNPFFQSWVATVLTTAHHTWFKNTLQWLVKLFDSPPKNTP